MARDAPAPTVRVAQAHEVAAFDAKLADHHYLGAARPVGDYLRQLVERDGIAIALLVWGPGCDALKDRDRWIRSRGVGRPPPVVMAVGPFADYGVRFTAAAA